jgi:hypothetical protein
MQSPVVEPEGDPAVRAIDARRRIGEPINFEWLRKRYARHIGIKESLDWGTAVLGVVDQLDQYLWTYGLMVASQWHHAAPMIPSMLRPMRMIDYGCGQGLAGLLLHDIFGAAMFGQVQHLLLIEPSSVALARARAIYAHVAPHAELQMVCKPFDELQKGTSGSKLENLHIFSNVLDIPSFDAAALLTKALQPGRNVIVAVSPDRDFRGGTPRLVDLKGRVESSALMAHLHVVQNDLTLFVCDNPGGSPAVLWVCEVNVRG